MNRNLLIKLALAPVFLLWCRMPQTFGQTFTETTVPKYFGCKSTSSANNVRTPFAACFRVEGLQPSVAYDVRGGIALVSDPPAAYGAGISGMAADFPPPG